MSENPPHPPSPPGHASPHPPSDLASPVEDQRQLILALIGICAVVMLVALDSTIVGTTLPRVVAELGGMPLYAWVGTGYLLASAIVIPIFGRLGDLFGRKYFILVSLGLVSLGSVLCGISQSMPQLIAARTLQGVGGGMMIATAFAAPADLFPDAMRRVRWQALISTSFAVASGIGPLLGGAITEAFGWRAAFFVSPVMGVVAFVMLWRYFPPLKPRHDTPPRIDWLGGGLLALAVGTPMAALELGFSTDPRPVLGLAFLAVAVVSVFLLVRYERRLEQPMFPLRVLERRESRLLNVVGVMTGAVMFILIYYGPLLLQVEVGLSPTQAGMILAPLVACIPIGSVINGRLFPRQSQPQRLMVFGALLLAVGCLGVMFLERGSSMAFAVVSFGLAGVGMGFIIPNLTLFMQMIAERRDVGVASALIQTMRTLGSAVGTALVGLIIARTSVNTGIEAGMVMAIVFCAVMMVLSQRIKMKNVRR
ncbi:MFS transporter [Pigmentiphaga sp. YJ18]|uniref:MFS transporter n=1 Tax=Pigmentiphaga sp. YJ18 TaxID=3134907 RepID=UPI003112D2BF